MELEKSEMAAAEGSAAAATSRAITYTSSEDSSADSGLKKGKSSEACIAGSAL